MIFELFCIMVAAGIYYKDNIIRLTTMVQKKYESTILILKTINNLAEAQKPTQASFIINDSDQSASIVYKHYGINHTLFVPFSRHYSVKMVCLQGELLYKDGTKIDITQEPGIPYLCSALELGGISITIYNIDTGDTHTYTGDHKPAFCLEVL